MCVHKHLMTIEAYAQETSAIETDETYRSKLGTLAAETRDHRDHEEKALCGEGDHEDLIDWARDWRKQFEGYALACDVASPVATCSLEP
jgi:hypothetical protein